MQVNYHFILHAQLSECVLRCSLKHSRDLWGILKCHYNEICVAVYVYMHACLPACKFLNFITDLLLEVHCQSQICLEKVS